MPTARDRARVLQRVYRPRNLNPITIRGDNLAVGFVVQLSDRRRPHARVVAALNRAAVGQRRQGLADVVHAMARALDRATVGHARIAGRISGYVNPRATLALNCAAVDQRPQGTRAHTMLTPGDLARVLQRAYHPRTLNRTSTRGNNPARGLVFQPGDRRRPHARLGAALYRAAVGQGADGVPVIIQTKGGAFNRPAVGDGGRPGSRAGQHNPSARFALNHRPGIVDQTLNKPHTDTIRAALNNATARV